MKTEKPRPPLAARVRQLRLERDGLTQVEAADAIGIRRTTLASIETGEDKPGRDTAAAIADYYGVSVDYLLTGRPLPDKTRDAGESALLRRWRTLSADERVAAGKMLGLPQEPER